MAKVVGPLHSSEARGSVGALTYNTWRGISIVKARSGPTTQYSDAQVALRALAALATTSWQGLTDAERHLWHLYAADHTDLDWTGNPQRLSGYNWYIRANVRAQVLGKPIREAPPTVILDRYIRSISTVPQPLSIVVLWDIEAWPIGGDLHVEIYGTGPHSAGRHPTIKQCVRVGSRLSYQEQFIWSGLDPGLHTVFIRPVHAHGITAGWARTTGTANEA